MTHHQTRSPLIGLVTSPSTQWNRLWMVATCFMKWNQVRASQTDTQNSPGHSREFKPATGPSLPGSGLLPAERIVKRW